MKALDSADMLGKANRIKYNVMEGDKLFIADLRNCKINLCRKNQYSTKNYYYYYNSYYINL